MIYADLPDVRDVLPGIRARADRCDLTSEFPDTDLRILASIGAMRWAVPTRFGGEALSPIELHYRYEAIASSSLATALILTQRDSAIGLLDASRNDTLQDELLPKLAANEIFATVGIAQLTTSRQRGAPALLAERVDRGFILRGEIPWSTAADRAQFVIAGAAVSGESGKQILFALPTDLAGVRVEPPMQLVALAASHTCAIACDDAEIDDRHVLAGPMENVLSVRQKQLPVGQAFLAVGLACGAINLINEHDSGRARELTVRFESQFTGLRGRVLDQCSPTKPPDPASAAQLRGACNEFALRVTHSAVALYKGTALLADHPAQRLAREAMFLLVWSCPDPVIDYTIDSLSAKQE